MNKHYRLSEVDPSVSIWRLLLRAAFDEVLFDPAESEFQSREDDIHEKQMILSGDTPFTTKGFYYDGEVYDRFIPEDDSRTHRLNVMLAEAVKKGTAYNELHPSLHLEMGNLIQERRKFKERRKIIEGFLQTLCVWADNPLDVREVIPPALWDKTHRFLNIESQKMSKKDWEIDAFKENYAGHIQLLKEQMVRNLIGLSK